MGAGKTPLIRPEDLRLRLVAAFILIAALAQVRHLAVAAPALLAAGVLALLVLRDPRIWHRLLHVEAFVVLLFVTLPFAVPGEPIFALGPLTASVEGLGRAALIACKVAASVLILLAFLAAVDPNRLGGALRGLRLPEPLVRLFVLTVRYLGLLREEAARLREAMRARGFQPRTNRHTWQSYGNLVGMLLVRAMERSRRVEEAMRCRGYDGRFPYAALPAPALRDWIGFALATTAALAVVLCDRL